MTLKGLVFALVLAMLCLVPSLPALLGVSVRGFVLSVLGLLGVSGPGSEAPGKLPPPIAQIQSMSDLATTRVHISTYIEGDNNHFEGRWALHGEVVLGVDLSQVSYGKLDQETRRQSAVPQGQSLEACR
jgi:hypothetical protein